MTETSTPRHLWHLWPALACLAMAPACVARQPVDPSVLGRLGTATNLAFAYELAPGCSLEAIPGELSPERSSAWKKISPNELVSAQLAVVDRRTRTTDEGMSRMLEVRDGTGRTRWIRNTPAPSAAEVEQRWSCAADGDLLATRVKSLTATTVRLVPNAPSCMAITPVLGDAADVTFDPYTVLGRRLVRTTVGLVAVVTLATADGEDVLSLSASDLDSCFAVTKRGPTSSAERDTVSTWLGDTSAPPPSAALPSYLQTAGLEEKACLAEGQGPTRHDECRAAPFGITAVAAGPGGLPTLRFFRERVTDAVHAYGGKLAPADELAGVNVLVRQIRGGDDVFGASFTKALLASMLDAPKQRTRASHGYRLLRSADVANGTTTNANLDIDVAFTMPKLETTAQDRRQRKVRGKTSAPNPAYGTLARRLDGARAAATRAEGELTAYQGLYGTPLPRCAAGLPIACDVGTPKDVAVARLAKRRARISSLEASAKAVPPTIEQDDIASIDYHAKVHRRQGEATVTFKLTPTDALPGTPPLQVTRKVPFDATEVEVIADAAKGVEAKAARPPEQPQVAAAVASAVLAESDQVLGTWMRRATASAPPAAFEPGSRAQLALLARYVASNRRVKLFSDLTEERTDRLGRGRAIDYPITIPEGAGRCFAFVAVPTRGSADVNLVLRTREGGVLVARDTRAAPDAGFDVCPPSGTYTLSLSTGPGGPPAPVALGMFESTPGVAPDPDYGATMPPALRDPKPGPSTAPPASSVPPLR